MTPRFTEFNALMYFTMLFRLVSSLYNIVIYGNNTWTSYLTSTPQGNLRYQNNLSQNLQQMCSVYFSFLPRFCPAIVSFLKYSRSNVLSE